MTFCIEFDENTDNDFDFEAESVGGQVAEKILEAERCPYDVCVNVLVTDNGRIRELNKAYRDIDRETDVLSFPNIEFETAGKFDICEENRADCFEPESGELMLGDIILSRDKIREQAASYGHSEKREFAFLVAHSMLHLCGYDHMTKEDAAVMEDRQEAALAQLGITRE